MSIKDQKITSKQLEGLGISSAPDRLTGTAAENKALFDRLVKEAVAPSVNGIVEVLSGTEGAVNIGTEVEGLNGTNVGAVLTELKTLCDKSVVKVQLSGTNLIATLKDGTKTTISLAKFSDSYVFNDSGQIDFTVTDSGSSHTVTAGVKSKSITLGHLAVDAVNEINEAVQKAELAAEKAQAIAGGNYATVPELNAHTTNKNNPHGVTAAQLGAAKAAEHNIKTFYGIGQLAAYNEVQTSTITTLAQVVEAMPSGSILLTHIDQVDCSDSNGTVPQHGGVIEVTKLWGDGNRNKITYQLGYSGSTKTMLGYTMYDSNTATIKPWVFQDWTNGALTLNSDKNYKQLTINSPSFGGLATVGTNGKVLELAMYNEGDSGDYRCLDIRNNIRETDVAKALALYDRVNDVEKSYVLHHSGCNNLLLSDGTNQFNVLKLHSTSNGSGGAELVMGASGNTFVGAGEAATNLRADLQAGNKITGEAYGANDERLYLCADSAIILAVNCNNVADRKSVIISSGGALVVPTNTDYTTNKVRNIQLYTADTPTNALTNGGIYLKYK